MIQYKASILFPLLVIGLATLNLSEAKSVGSSGSEEPVIPSPNQDFGDEEGVSSSDALTDIQRRTDGTGVAVAASESTVPIYVSPYVRPERDALQSAVAPSFEGPTESGETRLSVSPSRASPSTASVASVNQRDLKAAASYGHGHHGGGHYAGGHGSHGWLDMGAWTGKKGSFGWYADYPVGSKHQGKGHY